MEANIIEKTHLYVEHLLPPAGTETVQANDLRHTRELVAVAEKIGRASALDEEEMRFLLLAAWLHDLDKGESGGEETGNNYIKTAQFLESSGLSTDEINTINQCIAATHYPQHPKNNVEEVLCDAVASFMASPEYLAQAEKQVKATTGKKMDYYEWLNSQKEQFKKHTFFTKYAHQTFAEGKEKNRKLLKSRQQSLVKDNTELEAMWDENRKLKKDLEKEKEQKASKGIETMFRTTMASHLQLSMMADNKANLMISINAIIASIMISSFVRNFAEVPHLIIPTVMLTMVCIGTIVFAILSTRPNIKSPSVPKENPDILFFGDFVHLSPDLYQQGMRNIMRNHEQLYNSMISNLYLQGKVLAKKYRLLKVSYNIFMVGFALVLLTYAIAYIFFGN